MEARPVCMKEERTPLYAGTKRLYPDLSNPGLICLVLNAVQEV